MEIDEKDLGEINEKVEYGNHIDRLTLSGQETSGVILLMRTFTLQD